MKAASLVMRHLLMAIWVTAFATARTHSKKTAVECVVAQEEPEVYLTCGPNGLINILSAHVGHQNVTSDPVTCATMALDDCVLEITTLDALLHSCMGMSSCNKVAYHPEHDKCGDEVNYFQVDYECITNNDDDTHAVTDICGDSLGATNTVTQPRGFIQSLGYPDTYSPLTSCSCNLTALDPGTTIQLTVLDIDLGLEQRATNARDWLEYTFSVNHWGEGHVLNNAARNEAFQISGGKVFLNFRTDSTQQGRGFWLGYEGVAADGKSDANINVHCSEFTPSDHKSDITCYQDEGIGELYLSCRAQGVINILSAIRGYHPNMTFENCSPVKNFTCSESAMDDHELFTMCMGRVECNPPARQHPLSDCLQESNYMQVLYQCIAEETDGTSSIIDICGDATGDSFIERSVGFLETLNYPSAYFPQQKCTCRLQAIDEDTEIVLSIVDLSLDHAECTKTKDWIEYTVGGQNWGKGVRLCGNIPGEAIHTGTRKLYTNFFSDVNIEGRGVWIKYLGKSSDGSLRPVKVICGDYHPERDLPEDVIPNYPPPGDRPTSEPSTSKKRTGLIAGLSVIAILMMCAAAGMMIYKCKGRPPRKQLQDDTSSTQTPSAINRFETGYGTLKYPGFSTRKDGHGMPYTNLDDDKSVHSRDSNLRERSKGISRISGTPTGDPTRPTDNSSGYSSTCTSSDPGSTIRSEVAYSNPIFEGTWGRNSDPDKLKV